MADSERIARMLDEPDIECLIWPLSEPRHLVPDRPVDPSQDGVVFTSANAVPAFAALTPHRDWPAFCVGKRTAEVAQAFGFPDCRIAGGDVRSLIDVILVAGSERLIYARGSQISLDLKSELASSGRVVTEMIVYEMADGPAPDSQIQNALACGKLDIVTIWSARNAIRFREALRQCEKVSLGGSTLVAISEKSLKPLAEMNFRRKYMAKNSTADAMIEAIRAESFALRQ